MIGKLNFLRLDMGVSPEVIIVVYNKYINLYTMLKKEKRDKKVFTKTLYISGMHCASCEILIEKKLLEQKGIDAVDVSLKDSSVTFAGKRSVHLTPDYLNNLFTELGYTFCSDKNYQKNSVSKKEKIRNYLIAVIVVLLVLIFFVSLDNSFLAKYSSVDKNSSLLAFMILGFVASISSCAALIGGLLLSLTKKWNESYFDKSLSIRLKSHIQFHIGRIVAYMLGGAILGMIGDVLSFDNLTFFSTVILIVSLIMLVVSLQMIGFSWAQKFRFALPKSIIGKFNSQKTKAPFVIGFGTFFLPCGFTLIAQGIALTTGSLFYGMLVMGAFALGTLPMLFAISFGSVSMNRKPHLAARFNVVAGALIFIFAVYNINGQLNVLGLPSFSDLNKNKVKSDEVAGVCDVSEDCEEEQIIKFIADEFEYKPVGSTTLKAGIPTKLIVDNQGIVGCGAQMAARGLFKGVVSLKSGENVVEFTPKKGVYKLTCSMGMVPPVTIRVE